MLIPWNVPDYLDALVLGAIFAFFLTPLARRVAMRTGALAWPLKRSVHTEPMPQLGGLAIYGAFALGCLTLLEPTAPLVQALLIGGALITAVGLYDDLRPLSPAAKIFWQVAAAGILVAYGVRIEWVTHPLGGGLLHLDGWLPLAVPITILWVVAMVNVLNFVDGLDGLAAGIAAIAATILLLAALQLGHSALAVVLMGLLAGTALGFLPHNFNPARIFMGDSGAMFLGYVLAAIAIEGVFKGPALLAVAVPVLAVGLPIFDMLATVLRRWRAGDSVYKADRGHLHHQLLRVGLSHRDAVITMYLLSGWLGISALAVMFMNGYQALGIITFVFASLIYGANKLGLFGRRRRGRGLRDGEV